MGITNKDVLKTVLKVPQLEEQLDSIEQKKANKDEVVKKGNGTLNDFDETTRAMIQGIEQGQINAVLGYKNVTPFNSNYFKRGINLHNKITSIDNAYVNHANGNIVKDSYSVGFFATDFIPIENETIIKCSSVVRHRAFYDVNCSFIEGKNEQVNSFSIPLNAKYMRLSFYGLADKQNLMIVNNSNSLTPYVEYVEFIPFNYTEAKPFKIEQIPEFSISTQLLKNKCVTPSKIEGCEIIGNLLPSAVKLVKGKYAYDLNGKLTEVVNESYCYFIIEVDVNTQYSFTEGRFVVGLSDLENSIFYEQNLKSTNSRSARYLAISFNYSNFPLATYYFVKGNDITLETKYKIEWLDKASATKTIAINIPKKLYKLEGYPLNIYFDNIIDNVNNYNVDVICNNGIHYENRVGSFNISSDTNISLSVYDEQTLVNKVDSIIKHIPSNTGQGITKKCLFIGDSTTEAGAYTQKILDLFASDVMKIELLGTRGSGLNRHEGRSGWSANEYCNIQQLTDKVNAFYNPTSKTFDFTYYMTQQNYSSVDYVFIHLGINDIFNFNSISEFEAGVGNIIANFNKMINSIKSYNANIKVCLMLTIPPNSSQNAFGSQYGCGRTRWVYKSNYHKWVNKLIETYDNRESENIYCVPINIILDTTVDINDAVHPKKDVVDVGYNKMALPIYYFIKYLGGI